MVDLFPYQNYNYNLTIYYMCVSNTIDFTFYNDFPITGPGYIPGGGFTIGNIDEISMDAIMPTPVYENKKRNVLTEFNFDVLFAQRSSNHVFSKGYLEFIQFCLSMILNMDAESIEKVMMNPIGDTV